MSRSRKQGCRKIGRESEDRVGHEGHQGGSGSVTPGCTLCSFCHVRRAVPPPPSQVPHLHVVGMWVPIRLGQEPGSKGEAGRLLGVRRALGMGGSSSLKNQECQVSRQQKATAQTAPGGQSREEAPDHLVSVFSALLVCPVGGLTLWPPRCRAVQAQRLLGRSCRKLQARSPPPWVQPCFTCPAQGALPCAPHCMRLLQNGAMGWKGLVPCAPLT